MITPSNRADPHLDVVFVHGLGSDTAAWENKETKFNWPEHLESNDERLQVFNITHHAPMFNSRDTSAVSAQFQITALGFLDQLRHKGVGKRPIVFVAHSLGGIIVKQALFLDRESEDGEVRKGRILENTRCVVFLSTPHAGAAIANAATYLGPFVKSLGTFAATLSGFTLLSPFGLVARLGTGFLARRVRSSKLTSQLARGDAALLSLNYWYRRLPDIKTHAFYETELTYRCVHVVDPLSADPGVSGCIPRRAESKDHISICKPPDANDSLFVAVKNIIDDVRDRTREGKDYPAFRNEIHETMSGTPFVCFADKGNFADIPAAKNVRKNVEHHLRDSFRKLFEDRPIRASQEKAVASSKYDIDKFVLSLWLEQKVKHQVATLSTFIEQAESSLRKEDKAAEPTSILMYRAARTFEKVLFEIDYGALEQMLTKAYGTVLSRYSMDQKNGRAEKGFDANRATQELLQKLATVAKGFDEVKRELAKLRVPTQRLSK